MVIDTEFDVRSDATTDDPDQSSPTLRRYHRLLWSKPLPNRAVFELVTTKPGTYLHHSSEAGQFSLSSDSITHSYATWRSTASLVAQVPADDVETFRSLGYTIGGMLVFPSTKIDGKFTINMARGVHPAIRDRFDLTLECIRRYYLGDIDTPLGDVLARYRDFFGLFADFSGYVDFFLLHDLTVDEGRAVRFLLPVDGFGDSPLPRSVEAYARYREASMQFLADRNRSVRAWVREVLQ